MIREREESQANGIVFAIKEDKLYLRTIIDHLYDGMLGIRRRAEQASLSSPEILPSAGYAIQ
jgi:hypothetical protein